MTNEHRPTARVLDILEILSSTSEGLTLTEIATAINSPKSTILPIIRTLCQRKFLAFDKQTYRYVISINSFIVGSAYVEDWNILQDIKSEMQHIVDKSLETCQMGIIVHGDVLYLVKIDSPEPIRTVSFVGKRIPAYATALGKALLSRHTLRQLRNLYPNGLQAYTPHTNTDLAKLYEELKVISATNTASDFEEVTKDLHCYAVPLCKEDKVIASISVSMPSYRSTPEKVALIKELLLEAKYKIEKILINTKIASFDFMQHM